MFTTVVWSFVLDTPDFGTYLDWNKGYKNLACRLFAGL